MDIQMRTNVPHIFAIGDIVGQPMLAHKAVHEAHVAAEVIAGELQGNKELASAAFNARVIPSVAYTDPEVAWVGLTEDQAKAQGIKVKKGLFPWTASGRAIANGRAILGAQAMGADLAYIGSAFIATEEARAADAYKQAIVDCNSDDIVYSNLFTGVHGNYLAPSIRNAGMDPDNLPVSDPSKMSFGGDKSKAWKDIWGCGQGIGSVSKVQRTADFVAQLKREYAEARGRLLG